MKKTLLLASILVASLSSVAMAADSTPFYGGVNLGHVEANSLGGSLNDTFGPGATTRESDNNTSVGVKLGYNVNEWFGVEATYNRFGDFSGDVAGTRSRFDSVDTAAVWAVARYDFGNNWGVNAKLGYAHTYGDLQAAGSKSGEFNNNDWAYGLGASYSITKTIDLTADWDRYEDALNGRGDIDNFSGGVKFKF